MSSERGKLSTFLKEVIDWRWDDFCRAEMDPKYTGYQATVFSLVRTCSEGKLGAIKLAIDRVDGKLETPIKIEYPKIYFEYPYAEKLAPPTNQEMALELEAGERAEEVEEEEKEPETLAGMTLRQMVERMADEPKVLVSLILKVAKDVELKVRAEEEIEEDDMADKKVPLVKAVVAANLLHLAEQNNFEAITEVFDQIDGKLVDTIRILGDDVYVTQYAELAPYGAEKNEKGVYMIEQKTIGDLWKQKLKKD